MLVNRSGVWFRLVVRSSFYFSQFVSSVNYDAPHRLVTTLFTAHYTLSQCAPLRTEQSTLLFVIVLKVEHPIPAALSQERVRTLQDLSSYSAEIEWTTLRGKDKAQTQTQSEAKTRDRNKKCWVGGTVSRHYACPSRMDDAQEFWSTAVQLYGAPSLLSLSQGVQGL